MSNQWLRLWHDLPNDPKWRTISRISGQRIGDIIAVYIHMLVCASNATERGRTQGWSDEDTATALDLPTESVTAIRQAMHGRVIDGDALLGWTKRQPKREDGSASRAREWRESQRAQTQPNADERSRTQEEKREEEKEKKPPSGAKKREPLPDPPSWIPAEDWQGFLAMRIEIRKPLTKRGAELAIGKLTEWRSQGYDAIAILRDSIQNSYQGLFPPKSAPGTPPRPSSEPRKSSVITL